ncbi:SH3 domain-containing protein [Terrihabitans rhizophilus]|uniref:SH3 domain-containing protein n=1 Tax=Terrihabitans rhizophilus TaxID=3092662 RepID=A0ABU4RMZ5_9HYPH|nr:SH3 domain-containing protein [Terrihabitans sp. PJ23]MDX6805035.1 SH3 domain-containing protein [Terrihabitans sp. PJ23]
MAGRSFKVRALVRIAGVLVLGMVAAGAGMMLLGGSSSTGGPAQAGTSASGSAAAKALPAGGAVATGPVSGMPIPRFVSLKSDKVNVRRGPANDHDVQWVFTRASLPVEITAEWDNWRRIRDADGAEGWVFHSLLSGRRTALIAPWSKEEALPLYRRGDKTSAVVARLQPKVLATVKECDGSWCRIEGQGFDGWMEQEVLWGAYPNEHFD